MSSPSRRDHSFPLPQPPSPGLSCLTAILQHGILLVDRTRQTGERDA